MTSLLWLLTDAPGPAPWVREQSDAANAAGMVAVAAFCGLALWGTW